MILTILIPLVVLGDGPLWSEVARNRQGTHYVDAGHVKVAGDRKFIWHRIDYATPLANGAVTALYNVELNCRRRTAARWRGIERNPAGQVVRSREVSRPASHAIRPNSVGDRIFHYFCEPSAAR